MACQVKVNLGGPPRLDEDGNVVGGKMVDMVVEGNDVYFVSACVRNHLSGSALSHTGSSMRMEACTP